MIISKKAVNILCITFELIFGVLSVLSGVFAIKYWNYVMTRTHEIVLSYSAYLYILMFSIALVLLLAVIILHILLFRGMRNKEELRDRRIAKLQSKIDDLKDGE